MGKEEEEKPSCASKNPYKLLLTSPSLHATVSLSIPSKGKGQQGQDQEDSPTSLSLPLPPSLPPLLLSAQQSPSPSP